MTMSFPSFLPKVWDPGDRGTSRSSKTSQATLSLTVGATEIAAVRPDIACKVLLVSPGNESVSSKPPNEILSPLPSGDLSPWANFCPATEVPLVEPKSSTVTVCPSRFT